MSESMLAAVHAAAQPLATATPTQPAAAPPEQKPMPPAEPPAPAQPAAAAPGAPSTDANAVRSHAAGLAELYGLAHPASAQAFTALAADIMAGKSQADVGKSLLTSRQTSPDVAAPIDNHRKDNSVHKPGASTPVAMPSHAEVYGALNGQPAPAKR